MILDKDVAFMAIKWMPELEPFKRQNGILFVKVDKAMYGLKQSAKLWYKELAGFLVKHGFKICPSDECILHKMMRDCSDFVLIIYRGDILVLGGVSEHYHWVK